MESRDAYFDRVYSAYAGRLKRFLVVRIRRVSDMEDVYQETWRRFYERIGLLRPTEPMAYLTRIAKGELAKRYRQNSRESDLFLALDEDLPDAGAPFEPAPPCSPWSKPNPCCPISPSYCTMASTSRCGRSQDRFKSARTR